MSSTAPKSRPLYGHEAVKVAASLWDERDDDGHLRDLEPHEEAFLSAVHDARKHFDDELCEAALTVALRAYRDFDPDEVTIELEEAA